MSLAGTAFSGLRLLEIIAGLQLASRNKETGLTCRPPLPLKVGITGHRPNKLARDAGLVAGVQFNWIARCLETHVRKMILDTHRFAADARKSVMCLVSALAPGADQLAFHHMPPGWQLTAILPMPREHYELDFGEDADSPSRLEFARLLSCAADIIELDLPGIVFDGTMGQKAQYYHHLGRCLVDRSDLLVAIWDGENSAGPGGTAEVVTQAIDRQQPVVWIDSTAALPPRLLLSLGHSRSRHITAIATEAELGTLVAAVWRGMKANEGKGQGDQAG